MLRNWARVIPAGPLISRYSGVCRYSANARSQSAWDRGGTAPLTGFHSVIERPLSVSRVMPPTTTIANTKAATNSSRLDSARGRAGDSIRSAGAEERAESIGERLCACGEPRGKGENRGHDML